MDKKLEELLISFANACNLAKVGDSILNMAEFIAIDARITDMLAEATQRGVQDERARCKRRLNAVYGKGADGIVEDDPIPTLIPGTPKLTCNPFPTGHAAVNVKPEYVSLLGVLCEALDQAQHGKGAERHNLGGDTPFERQRMQTVSELVGSPDGMVYQAIKKLTEGMKLPTHERQVAELLGAINYIAGIIIFLRKQEHAAECKKMENALNDRPIIPQTGAY